MKKQPEQSFHHNRKIITVPVVKKNEEFYIRRSIQDYFIKFCESPVAFKDFQQVYKTNPSMIKTMKMEVEFKTGDWDNCLEKQPETSRKGEYVIIHKIFG